MKAKLLICGILLLGSLLIDTDAQQVITLKQAIRIAKENNPLLKIEIFNEDIAKTDIITAQLRPNLVLNNQSMVIANRDLFQPDLSAFNPYGRQTYWQVTKEIVPMRQWKKKVSLTEINASLMSNNYAEMERNVFLQVGLKWIDSWYNKTTINFISKASAIIDTVISAGNLNKVKQITLSTDILRMKLLADQYKLQMKSLQQQYSNELVSLKFLTGAKSSIAIDINDNFFSGNLTNKNDTLLYYALANRTDLQAEYTSSKYAKKNIDYQKALAWPIPDVGVIYNAQNGTSYVGIYGNIELPVFYRNQGDIQKSKILSKQAEQQLQTVQQQVVNEVKAALNMYLVQKQTIEEYKKIIAQSEQLLNAVKAGYIKGNTTLIDFLDVHRSWLDTQKMYYEAIYNYRKSYIQLLYVTGLINTVNSN